MWTDKEGSTLRHPRRRARGHGRRPSGVPEDGLMSALGQLAGRRILFLNWRDLSNPAAGGAEAYAEQIARRFSSAGALLTLFTSRYQGAPPYDWSNGYLVVREGGRFGVYRAAARHLRRYGHLYDAVVDFQNGIPFFAPRWVPASTAVVCVVHHVHQAQFDMYFRWPLNHVGRLLEGRVTRRVYRHRPFVAVSPSTRAEMRRQLGLREPVHIVPNGIDPLPPGQAPRSPSPVHRRRDQAYPAQAAASSRASSARTAAPLAGPPRGHRRHRASP